MPEQPLLTLASPQRVARPKIGGGGGSPLRLPTGGRQRARLTRTFRDLETSFSKRHATLLASPAGALVEEVLVLETAGTVEDLVKAVRRTPGMDWLVETDEFEVAADVDFGRTVKHPDEPFGARVYLVMANQVALQQMRKLWLLYLKQNRGEVVKFGYGMTKWRDIFSQLRDIRFWGIEDRVRDTGLLEDWDERVVAGDDRVRMEIELWFRDSAARRVSTQSELASLIAASGGQIVKTAIIDEIGYHALLVEIPIATAQEIIDFRDTSLASDGRIMFLRPVGQSIAEQSNVTNAEEVTVGEPPGDLGAATIALFDGLPLANHAAIASHLVIDDPDGYAASYGAGEQVHGTAMASLLVRGDLSDGQEAPLPRRIYVRPIMTPNANRIDRAETVPDDELLVDVVHRAVRRMLEGDEGGAPTAPDVRILSYSIGSPWRRFDRQMGSLARLIDWLSWKYNLLFVVSSGNCLQNVDTGLPDNTDVLVPSNELRRAVIRALWHDARFRRLLEPAESINALSVGASYHDAGAIPAGAMALYDDDDFPSPINPLGLGYRRSVKPDLLAPGGRTSFRRNVIQANGNLVLTPVAEGRAPGQLVAAPGPTPGDLSFATFRSGTSNATALTARAGGLVYEVLSTPPDGGAQTPDAWRPVLVKALLVHSAAWPSSQGFVEESISDLVGASRGMRQQLARFFGFGLLDPVRTRASDDLRATLIGWGELGDDEADVFQVPLPPSLSQRAVWRRLTATLAWFSPIYAPDRRYRQASLWFDPVDNPLDVTRQEADYHLVRRGTVQHEILEGKNAAVYADDRTLSLRVNCRADAGVLAGRVRYGLAVSIEVAADIPIYEEVALRLRTAIQI